MEKVGHYNKGKIEVIEVINDWKCNFNIGNAIKYIARCNYKGNKLEDLEKARTYLLYEIKHQTQRTPSTLYPPKIQIEEAAKDWKLEELEVILDNIYSYLFNGDVEILIDIVSLLDEIIEEAE